MTTPSYEVQVECEACGEVYCDWRRESVNSILVPMTEDEIEEQLSTRCPTCGHRDYGFGLIVDREVPDGPRTLSDEQ